MTTQVPLLLVSVRNADEARAALEGGADIIDVKEPTRGSLGRADALSLEEIRSAIAGQRPLSAAMGELLEFNQEASLESIRGYNWVKFGLSQCGLPLDWRAKWRDLRERVASLSEIVATAYADHEAAQCFEPRKFALAIHREYSIFLLDTFGKKGESVFDHISDQTLFMLRCDVRSSGGKFALAGSLQIENLPHALQFQPDIIGIRGAACDKGRMGRVIADKVADFRAALHLAANASVTTMQASN